eukprot:TRINITY_DN18035_c0_g1_i1.p1 TRINITY_DN18035_c0_g1~~TRINITY_DN18035_c0_g1_i1.p1  ORF type:complete len:923 (+),score=149.94 TRINITY_DN18035_c0_g1_i1:76-2844(+)
MPAPDLLPSGTFAKGERVFMWNGQTNQLDLEGYISSMLDSPHHSINSNLPKGSVEVTSADGAHTYWIEPEHFGTMLRKADGLPCLLSGGNKHHEDQKTSPAEKDTEDDGEEASLSKALGMMGRFFGISKPTDVGNSPVQPAGNGFTQVSGDPAGPSLQGMKSSRPPMQPGGDGSDDVQPPGVLACGTKVDIWNYQLNQWESGGVVSDILTTDFRVGGSDVVLPAGSVLVHCINGPERWFMPELAADCLRVAELTDVSADAQNDTSGPFKEGDRVHMFNIKKQEWQTDAMVAGVSDSPVFAGAVTIPAGSLTVSVRNGEEFHTITPDMFSILLKKVEADDKDQMNDQSSPPQADSNNSGVVAATDSDVDVKVSCAAGAHDGGDGKDDGTASAPLPGTSTPGSAAVVISPASSGNASPRAGSPVSAQKTTASTGSNGSGSGGVVTLQVPTNSNLSLGPHSPRSPMAPPSPSSPKPNLAAYGLTNPPPYDRKMHRILIIGPGFGRELNPKQGAMLEEAGFQLKWLVELPNPEAPGFPIGQFLPTITQAIEEFQPHLIACASKGGFYVSALWQTQLWQGPTLMINRNPSVTELPKNANVVIAQGSNDEFYHYPREHLENLMRTGSANRCFLYYTANSGQLGANRGCTRYGDKHNMETLKLYDTLPRLVDAALSSEGPEVQMMRSWRDMVTNDRLEAESWLGYTPGVRSLWQSTDQKGMDDQILFEVDPSSEEYGKVATLFKAMPSAPRAYPDMNPGMWEYMSILKIERVENGMQEDGSAEPYYKALQRGIENQGLPFQPGLHTRWCFHGSTAIESIVTNPISGFQPLMSGSRAGALWGPGTYFARDAKYVHDGGYCSMLPDGSKQMMLCLLMNGMVCLGDPDHKGVLPFRQGRHRYNSSVDSLGNPEIFVTQSPGAAYPAYVITYS